MLTPVAAGIDILPSERRKLAVEVLQGEFSDYRSDYRNWLREVDAAPTKLGQPPLWPSIWQAIERSLVQLIATFENERAEKQINRAR